MYKIAIRTAKGFEVVEVGTHIAACNEARQAYAKLDGVVHVFARRATEADYIAYANGLEVTWGDPV